jgi:hypothetical protein
MSGETYVDAVNKIEVDEATQSFGRLAVGIA